MNVKTHQSYCNNEDTSKNFMGYLLSIKFLNCLLGCRIKYLFRTFLKISLRDIYYVQTILKSLCLSFIIIYDMLYKNIDIIHMYLKICRKNLHRMLRLYDFLYFFIEVFLSKYIWLVVIVLLWYVYLLYKPKILLRIS